MLLIADPGREIEIVRRAGVAIVTRFDLPKPGQQDRIALGVVALSSLSDDERSTLVAALASLGDKEDAFRIIDLSHAMRISLKPSVLYEPATRSLRSDPRFLRVATDLGLVHYWTLAKHKPDFCTQQSTSTVCS